MMQHLRPWIWITFLSLLWASGPVQSKVAAQAPTAAAEFTKVWSEFLTTAAQREPAMAFPFESCFRRAAAAYDLPLALLLAVARGESDFEPRAKSHANAHGLMQILWPGTAKHLGIHRLADLYDPCTNVDAGSRYLKELMGRYDGNLHLALAAYNYGPGRIKSGARSLPKGAEWYSRYIHRHLSYVLGANETRPSGRAPRRYQDEQKLEVIFFDRPYRAEAFVKALQGRSPALRLDWFRSNLGGYRVVLLYQSDDELLKSKRLLKKAGFAL